MHAPLTAKWRYFAAIFAAAALAAIAGSTAQAATLSVCPSGCDFTSIQAAKAAATAGDTITVAAGTYNESGIVIDKSLTLTGAPGAKVVIANNAEVNGFTVTANDVTISGFEIAGPVTSSYLTYSWGSNISRGIAVLNGVTGFNITDNFIHDVRNGVLVDGRNSGSLTDNVIDNTKSGVSVQYTDAGAGNTEGHTVTMTGNSEGSSGNEWGLNLHLNGHFDGGGYHPNSDKIAAVAPTSVQQALLDNSTANGGWTVQDQGYAQQNRTDVFVSTSGSALNQGSPLGSLDTVQHGIDAVVTTGVVNVSGGTFPEAVSISRALTLNGVQHGVDARTRVGTESVLSLVSISSSNVIVDGISLNAANWQLRADSLSAVMSGIIVRNTVFSGYTDVAMPTYNAGDIRLEKSLFKSPSASAEAIQIKASTTAGGCSGSRVVDNLFDAATSNGGADVNFSCTGSNSSNVTVSGNRSTGVSGGSSFTAFSGVTDGISITGNTATTDGSAVFFFGSVSGSVTIQDNSFTGGGSSAVAILGGEYTSDVPSSGTFHITDNDLSSNARAVRVTASGLTAGGQVVAHGNNLSGSSITGVENLSPGSIDAASNWWGNASGPGTVSGVTTTPWCTVANCASTSNNANLASLSLSSGTLSPAFSSATTAYTAVVGNEVVSVTVTALATPGAAVMTAGGSSLAVGDNAMTVTVTSADGTATKTYTVTVSRAAGSGGSGGSGSSPPPTTTPSNPTPPPNEQAVVTAQPDQPGEATVVVAPPGTGGSPATAVSVSVGWGAGTFSQPATVVVAPKPELSAGVGSTTPPTPVAGGFAVGSTVVQLTVTSSSGAPVTAFVAPLVLHISAIDAGEVPAYSQDGSSWRAIPRLASPALPEGQADGYYLNADGSVDIYTRHATFFGLLKDTQAPSAAQLNLRVTKTGLRASWHGMSDNVQVTGYVLSRNGHGYKASKRTSVVLPLRAGLYTVRALDAAGNVSKASKTVRVVRRGQSFAIARS